jgi:hypothetical protein
MLLYFRDTNINLLIHYYTWLEKCLFLCLGQVQVHRQLSLYLVSIYLSSLTIFNQSHTHHMGTFTPHRGTHRLISIQRGTTHPSHGHPHPTQGHRSSHLSPERNDTPITWAHPKHGLSHKSTQLSLRGERVLEDVSRNCNHQQSIRPSLDLPGDFSLHLPSSFSFL